MSVERRKPAACGPIRSFAGQDKDTLFLAQLRGGREVLLADGRSRELGKPKRKDIRHVTFLPDSAFAAVHGSIKDHLTARPTGRGQPEPGREVVWQKTT